MLDNQLIAMFRPILLAGLAAQGFGNVEVVKREQPTMQGRNSGPTIYFNKIVDEPYGFLQFNDFVDENEELMVHKETQLFETGFQFNARVIQNPTDTSSVTASDLLKMAAMILQSNAARIVYKSSKVGILRVSHISNLWVENDQDEFEESPSFDLTFEHSLVTVSATPVIIRTEINVYPII